jgi:hypothetical protein
MLNNQRVNLLFFHSQIRISRFPLPLPEWLVGNPLFTAGFGLGAMGWDAQLTSSAHHHFFVIG